MAQTPALFVGEGRTIDYTPVAATKAGTVVNRGTIPMIVPSDIEAGELGCLAASGLWKVPQVGEVFAVGDDVYWDSTGNPYGGTAGSGCAKSTASAYLMGTAAAVSAATDTYVLVNLTGIRRAGVVGGAVTASGIAAEDLSLAITGLAGTAGQSSGVGGAIPITAGAGDSGIGGAFSATGGAGSAAAGGAASVVGGAGGAASVGGAASLTGGAPASGNAIGGAAAVTGGAGGGTQAGGVASLVGGAGGLTGAGGAIAVTGGAGGATSGTGGAVVIAGGAGTNANANGGALTLRGGAKNGSGSDGAIAIGDANTKSITMGVMPRWPVAAKTATGSTQAHALAAPTACLAEGINIVAAADDTTCVALPTAVAGAVVIVKSTAAGKNLQVFPNTDDAINAIAANGVYAQAADAGMTMFVAADATTWYTLPLVSS
jgi:predicted RecA/RadA family phage recombinase